jgi:hypothetical protein
VERGILSKTSNDPNSLELSEAIETYFEIYRRADWGVSEDPKLRPDNWPNDEESRRRIQSLARRESIVLFQVPNSATVAQLLALNSAKERAEFLTCNAQRIGSECGNWFRSKKVNGKYQAALSEVVENLSEGRFMSAQALAMPIIEDILSLMLSKSEQERVRSKDLDVAVGHLGMHFVPDRVYLWAYIYAAVKEVFKTKPMSGKYVATRLHRHTTAHFIQSKQYTARNAVVATLLACSIVALWSDQPRRIGVLLSSVRHPSNTNIRRWGLGAPKK